MKSPRLIVSISCSVTLMTSCLRNRTPSSSSILLLLLLLLTLLLMHDESEDSFVDLSSDPSVLTFAITLLPVRTERNFNKKHTHEHKVEDLLEKFLVASIVVRIAPFSFLRALNFFKQSTVSCL